MEMITSYGQLVTTEVMRCRHQELLRYPVPAIIMSGLRSKRKETRRQDNGRSRLFGPGLHGRSDAERLGRDLGQLLYYWYSELLDRGLPAEQALELVKYAFPQLTPMPPARERPAG